MKLIKILNPEKASEKAISQFKSRAAVRAIVYDQAGDIAILNVAKENYHKLPGGGLEAGEDNHTALKRECLEELGCNVEIYGELGEIVEYLKMHNLKQTSSCYLAKVIGNKGKPKFTPEEISNDFRVQWLPWKQAVSLLNSDKPTNEQAKLYILPRDIAFLESVA